MRNRPAAIQMIVMTTNSYKAIDDIVPAEVNRPTRIAIALGATAALPRKGIAGRGMTVNFSARKLASEKGLILFLQ